MSRLNFVKMQALGNDFILIDSDYNDLIDLDDKVVTSLADRKYGIGCDQVLFIKRNYSNDYNYLIFNNDGSKALNCLNGARCVIMYLYKKCNSLVSHFLLRLDRGVIYGTVDIDENINLIIDEPSYNPQSLPMSLELSINNSYIVNFNGEVVSFGIASLGNPHLMIELPKDIESYDILKLTKTAQNIQKSDIFLQGVNINFFNIKGDNLVFLRTYERGSGFTHACGSGACATACFLIRQNKVKNFVKVNMLGGSLKVNLEENNKVSLIGDANFVFNGYIEV